MAFITSQLNPKIGDAIPIKLNNKIIYYLITIVFYKRKYFHKPLYKHIKTAICNLTFIAYPGVF